MWLVYLQWFVCNQIELCIIAETKEKAKDYIKEQMVGKQYSGLGVYKIKNLPLI